MKLDEVGLDWMHWFFDEVEWTGCIDMFVNVELFWMKLDGLDGVWMNLRCNVY
jgi:hypothetical protein